MNTDAFLEILHNPELLQNEQVGELEDIVHGFPYFQAARALYLKGLKNQNSFRFNQSLKTTAIHTTQRNVLFRFITSDTFDSFQSYKQEKAIIEEIEVIDKTVIGNLHKEVAVKPREKEPITIETDDLPKVQENTELSFEIDRAEKIQPVAEVSDHKEDIQEDAYEEVAADSQQSVSFDENATYSFSKWMQLSSFKPIDRSNESTDIQDKNEALIKKFVTENPKMPPTAHERFTVDFSHVEDAENDTVMTETLARVYVSQKKYDSAIEAYKILSLKFPQKSSFFAAQIKDIEKLKNG